MFVVGDTDCVPDIALAPVQPLLAVHEVLFVEDQVRVADEPVVMEVGEDERVIVGVRGAVVRGAVHCAVVPPFSPPQLQVYVLVFVVTDDAVPALQRLVTGAMETLPPLLGPQRPFVGAGVMPPPTLGLKMMTLLSLPAIHAILSIAGT